MLKETSYPYNIMKESLFEKFVEEALDVAYDSLLEKTLEPMIPFISDIDGGFGLASKIVSGIQNFGNEIFDISLLSHLLGI
jgi:hypothetical protein